MGEPAERERDQEKTKLHAEKLAADYEFKLRVSPRVAVTRVLLPVSAGPELKVMEARRNCDAIK